MLLQTMLTGLIVLTITTSTQGQEPKSPALYLHCFGPNAKGENVHHLSTRVYLGEEIEIIVANPHPSPALKGKVEAKGEHYFADITGMFGSVGTYKGEMKLDTPYSPSMYLITGSLWPCGFILSTQQDIRPYLKKYPRFYQSAETNRKSATNWMPKFKKP